MSTTAAFPPVPSTLPTPSRGSDVFDFLHDRRPERHANPSVKVQENADRNMVAVTVEMSDGRSVRRKVPAACWREKDYRQALIRSMSMLVA